MAWIELHQSLWTHRKTFALADALNIDETLAGAHLARLWTWALDNVPDGDLTDVSPRAIARGAGWNGDPELFSQRLIDTGWVDVENEREYLHDWHSYAGRLIDRRVRERERSANRRATEQRPVVDRATTAGTVPNPTVPNQTTEASASVSAGADESSSQGAQIAHPEARNERPIPLPKRTVVTEEWLEDEREHFRERLPGSGFWSFDRIVTDRMNGTYFKRATDKRKYLHGQLENAAERWAAEGSKGNAARQPGNQSASPRLDKLREIMDAT